MANTNRLFYNLKFTECFALGRWDFKRWYSMKIFLKVSMSFRCVPNSGMVVFPTFHLLVFYYVTHSVQTRRSVISSTFTWLLISAGTAGQRGSLVFI